MNILLLRELEKIENELDITQYQLSKIIEAFNRDMEEKKNLKMLHTYFYGALSYQDGEYLSVDFGGTNVRIILYEISGKEIIAKKIKKFKLKDEKRDLTTNDYTLLNVFEVIATEIEKIVDKRKKYKLGHTFSFPMESKSKNEAILTGLSKGFKLRNSIGEDVNKVFLEALDKKGILVEPVSILNDTTATFLTGSFYEKNVDMAVIVGTGHNICFKDKKGEIINIESGYFCENLPVGYYDLKHLEEEPKLKNHLMEIMTGGKYIGQTANYIVKDLVEQGLLDTNKQINGKVLTDALNGELDNSYLEEEKEVISYIAKILLKRSAKLISAEIIAILYEIDSELSKNHTIVFDGSVYEKNEYFRENLEIYLEKYYKEKAKKIKKVFIKDASSIGGMLSIF